MVRAHGLKEGQSRLLLKSAQICIQGRAFLCFLFSEFEIALFLLRAPSWVVRSAIGADEAWWRSIACSSCSSSGHLSGCFFEYLASLLRPSKGPRSSESVLDKSKGSVPRPRLRKIDSEHSPGSWSSSRSESFEFRLREYHFISDLSLRPQPFRHALL